MMGVCAPWKDRWFGAFLLPRKLRELIRELNRAGFVDRGGRGSHRNFEHLSGTRVTISGQLGGDVKPYQEREVRRAIAESETTEAGEEES